MGGKSSRKYGEKATVVDGIKFPSMGEARRYQLLRLREKAGEIANLRVQPKFWLTCGGRDVRIRSAKRPNGTRCSYTADFEYDDLTDDRHVVEDFKGYDTYRARLKRAVVEAEYGIRIEVVR